jgi:aldehyde dehydrogenase (NAD+)
MGALAETIPSPTHPDLARLDDIVAAQRARFDSGDTLPREFREAQLTKLLEALHRFEPELNAALAEDLHKSPSEAWLTEVGFVSSEAKHALKKLGRWMKNQSTGFAPIIAAPARSYIHHQPLGLNLIVSPWNYPVHLALCPLVAALAAGNVALIKPSELAPACSAVVTKLIRETFDESLVAIIEGGVEVSTALLARKWDHIFFTGSTAVGRIVARAAAEHMTRVTLELGGKTPAIVTASADLELAAKRILVGKTLNAGQTCIAPDYVLVEASVHDALLDRLQATATRFFGDDPQANDGFGRIINDRHFERVRALIDPDKVVFGGQTDATDRYIAPTVMRDVTLDDPVMEDEIFGPVLPVIKVESLDAAMAVIAQRPEPLALYLFTTEPEDERRIVDRVSFGGGCINDTLVHMADGDLPFGGIGASGMGAYHGWHGFERFSHKKGITRAATFIDPSIKYPPFGPRLGLFKRVFG